MFPSVSMLFLAYKWRCGRSLGGDLSEESSSRWAPRRSSLRIASKTGSLVVRIGVLRNQRSRVRGFLTGWSPSRRILPNGLRVDKHLRSAFKPCSSQHQFGFKRGHGCSEFSFVLKKETVDYYLSRGNKEVYVCALDLSKAYDKVSS